ncbi:hypothetical protein KAX97_11765 [candidate division WOR-3 bacterium]|nr:hypothetical protein [candidate division WOR-3 bacterium]
MALPELLKKSVEDKLKRYCKKKLRGKVHDDLKINFRIRGDHVSLFEERRAFLAPEKWVEIPVAQFRYNPKDKM